jgi:hypothetical protein
MVIMFVGNDKLYHLLTQGNYEMRMDMSDFDNGKRFVKYKSIALGNEETKYKMFLSGFSGDIGTVSNLEKKIDIN